MTLWRDAAFLAGRHLAHHRGRSVLLVSALFLVMVLPITVDRMVDVGEQNLRRRATGTPLVAGAPGAAIDLVLAALYFRGSPSTTFPVGALSPIVDDGLATVYPLVLGDRAKRAPLVGTDPDYLRFRGLTCTTGRPFVAAGECVLGAAVAARTGVAVGEGILTEPRELFDLAGAYPLRMSVVGVLGPTGQPDDEAIFTTTGTAWIVQGLGHGHESLETADDPELVMGEVDGTIVGTAKVREYVEITAENRDSFHFHGATTDLPVDAAIVVPTDSRDGTILYARAETDRLDVQLVRSREVIDDLLVETFRVRRILLAVVGAVAGGTLLLLAVVVALSVRIRAAEIETMHLIGCGRGRVPIFIATEIVLLFLLAAAPAIAVGGLLIPLIVDSERLIIG